MCLYTLIIEQSEGVRSVAVMGAKICPCVSSSNFNELLISKDGRSLIWDDNCRGIAYAGHKFVIRSYDVVHDHVMERRTICLKYPEAVTMTSDCHRLLPNCSVYTISLTMLGSTRGMAFRHFPKVPHSVIDPSRPPDKSTIVRFDSGSHGQSANVLITRPRVNATWGI